MSTHPVDTIEAVCDRADAGTATPEDYRTLSRWARKQAVFLRQIIQRGRDAAEGRE